MEHRTPIDDAQLAQYRQSFAQDPQLRALRLMMSRSELGDAAYDMEAAARVPHQFSVQIPTTGITDQQQSGRCWLFASMNLMREQVISRCELDEFELSGNYLGFWDKFEKANFFLNCALSTADLPLNDRTVNFLLTNGISDGGQWDMMVSVVKKYGVVPKSAMPESAQSKHTAPLMNVLNSRLRQDALELRALAAAGKDPEPARRQMLAQIYNALVVCFGMPPRTFDFEYTDKNKVYHADRGLTGRSFFEKYVGLDLDDYVSVINAPTEDKPFGRTYTVRYLGNVAEGRLRYLNLPLAEFKALAVRQMQAGQPVWFGSDCGKCGDRGTGLWDPAAMDYSTALGGLPLGLTKGQRLETGDSLPNHAMLLCGVNLNGEGCPDRWKIENSWGEKSGNKGYFVASDAWFDEYVYQLVIHKQFLSDAQRAALERPPIVLEPWDPMGALA